MTGRPDRRPGQVSSRASGEPSSVRRPAYLVEFAFLRAVAIVAVIVIHAVDPAVVTGSAGPLLWPYVAIDVAAHVAVPLFVFVSGAVLMHAHPPPVGPRPFVARRLARLLPPYLAVSAVYLLVRAAEEGLPGVPEIAIRLLTGTAWFHLWFVVLMVELALLYPLIAPRVRFARPRTLGRLVVPLALLASAYFLLKALLFLGGTDWVLAAVLLQGLAPAGYLLFFVAGMAVTAHPTRSGGSWRGSPRSGPRSPPSSRSCSAPPGSRPGSSRLRSAPFSPGSRFLRSRTRTCSPSVSRSSRPGPPPPIPPAGPAGPGRARRGEYGIYLVHGGVIVLVIGRLARYRSRSGLAGLPAGDRARDARPLVGE